MSKALKLLGKAGRIVFLLTCTIPAFSQNRNLRFSHLTINDGLSQGLVWSITQDSEGFMWFATKDGLNRFDGYEFKVYYHDPFDSTSLSDNVVSVLFTDSRGRLWIGTNKGILDLYDPLHDRFIHFLTHYGNPGQVTGNQIVAITEDKEGNLWVGSSGNGLFKLTFPKDNPDSLPSRVTHYIHQPGDSNSLASNFIIKVFADHNGKLWISSINAPVQYANPEKEGIQFHFIDYSFQRAGRKSIPGGFIFDPAHCSKVESQSGTTFYEDSLHRLWMGGINGLFLFNQQQRTVTFFDIRNPGIKQGIIASICSEPFHNAEAGPSLWLGIYRGVGIFNTKTFTLQIVEHNRGDHESIQKGWIIKIYQDKSGCMWAGNNGYGLSKFDPRSALFPIPAFHNADHTVSSKSLSVRSFLDTKKYLLIGTTNGLWIGDKVTRLMHKASLGGRPRHPSLIYSIVPAGPAAVWLAGNGGLIWYSISEDKTKLFLPGISNGGLPDDRIYKLYKDGRRNLWCLTGYTFSVFNIARQKFTHYFYTHKSINVSAEPAYGDIYQDPKGNFWLGTGEGLLYFDTLNKTFHRYVTDPSNAFSLSFNAVRCVLPDPKQPDKYLWIGTAGGGLNRFDLHTKKFIHFTVKDGLPNNVTYGILPDKQGNLWISTNKGISKFSLSTHQFHNYNVSAGLQSNEFNSGAFYKNKQGKLFFGGVDGFNAFYSANIKSNPRPPKIVFTDFSLFNHSVSINDKNSPLKYAISKTKQITLPYKDNIISFQVAGLDYSHPANNQYAYKLTPANKDWILMGNNRLITFNNPDPGHYVLYVKAANSDGIWSKKPISLDLTILPPWWRTWWAYLIYFLIIVTLFYFLRRYDLNRIQLRNRLRIEHLESRKLKELDHLKSRFFANISHEFRTPLTLIMGPLEDLLKGGDSEKFKSIIPEMHRNSKRLLQLINQLLDLSKLDAGRYQVNTSREDIIPFVKQIIYSFSSLAKRKNIELELEVSDDLQNHLQDESTHFYFDDDIMEKILNNLLSNAFKFTPLAGSGGGKITVCLDLQQTKPEMMELKVADNGVGIPAEKLPYIFDRFYQVEDNDKKQYEGSGIGLALIKELVELHQGTIRVSSKAGQGAIFSCYLPLNRKIISEDYKKHKSVSFTSFIIEETTKDTEEESIHAGKNNALVLIVEDQRDVRKYIREKLQDSYEIIEAENGREGLTMGLEKIPDLVISDVMMPVRQSHPGGPKMDGFELCRKLKADNRTSHIPVILLTARAEDADKITGLETGADAYMIKPFNSQELLIRVKNLIAIRNKLRAAFSGKLFVKPSEITVTSTDREFIEKLLATVENHISDAKFSVDDLGKEVNMSASQINRKLNAIIDQTTQQFINSVRMQRAMDLLKGNPVTILEVAWQVGFENSNYFSKVFKKHFGCLPSEKEKFPA